MPKGPTGAHGQTSCVEREDGCFCAAVLMCFHRDDAWSVGCGWRVEITSWPFCHLGYLYTTPLRICRSMRRAKQKESVFIVKLSYIPITPKLLKYGHAKLGANCMARFSAAVCLPPTIMLATILAATYYCEPTLHSSHTINLKLSSIPFWAFKQDGYIA